MYHSVVLATNINIQESCYSCVFCGKSASGTESLYKCAPLFLLVLIEPLGFVKGMSIIRVYGIVLTRRDSFQMQCVCVQVVVTQDTDSR